MTHHIGSKWPRLGSLLGLSDAALQNIRENHKNNQQDMITEMLITWRDGYSGSRTKKLGCLANALSKIGLRLNYPNELIGTVI